MKDQICYAFIDAQNIHQGIQSLGWIIDWMKFRIYLKEKYSVSKAYVFIGYIQKNEFLYTKLKKAGFILIFKPVSFDTHGKPKGNCDADLVLHTLVEYPSYTKAIIVTSDGDFYSLVRYLYSANKLQVVLSPHKQTCSLLLKNEAAEKIRYLDEIREKIYK
jgi:uncharacterized LabA/DUF88 family protein